MANYKVLVPFILKWEGGFVNDPHDRGGATNKGVTFATWQDYCKRKGKVASVASLKAMTLAEWEDIFKHLYWDRMKADQIQDQSVANILVDWIWASGSHAIRHIQRLVGVKVDGMVGPKTLRAINDKSPLTLFGMIHKDRLDFVDDIVRHNPSQKRFINGWKNRINAIHYGQLNMI